MTEPGPPTVSMSAGTEGQVNGEALAPPRVVTGYEAAGSKLTVVKFPVEPTVATTS